MFLLFRTFLKIIGVILHDFNRSLLCTLCLSHETCLILFLNGKNSSSFFQWKMFFISFPFRSHPTLNTNPKTSRTTTTTSETTNPTTTTITETTNRTATKLRIIRTKAIRWSSTATTKTEAWTRTNSFPEIDPWWRGEVKAVQRWTEGATVQTRRDFQTVSTIKECPIAGSDLQAKKHPRYVKHNFWGR